MVSSSHSEQSSPMLPTATDQTAWKSIYIAGTCAFIQSTQFSIFFSSMWPYLLTLQHDVKQSSFGIVVALYSFSQCICSPLFGYWSNKIGQVRLPLVVGFCIMALGNISYLSLQFVPSHHLYVMMAARFIAGGGTGNMSLLRSYASTASTMNDRSRALACVSGGIAVGSMIGPGLQMLFTPFGAEGVTILGFVVNIYTSPALFCLFLNIVGTMVVHFAFSEEYIADYEKKNTHDHEEKHATTRISNPDFIAIMVCVFTRFTQIFFVTTIEAIGSAYSMMMFSFEKEEAVTVSAAVHSVAGAIAATFFFVFIVFNLNKYVKTRFFTMVSLGLALLFFITTYSYPFYSSNVKISLNGSDADCDYEKYGWCKNLTAIPAFVYYTGYILVFGFSGSILNITVTTLYSKVIGPRPQGTYHGVYQMSGSFGRMVAPLLMSTVYSMYGPRPAWLILMADIVFVMILWLVFNRRMVPFDKYQAAKTIKSSGERIIEPANNA